MRNMNPSANPKKLRMKILSPILIPKKANTVPVRVPAKLRKTNLDQARGDMIVSIFLLPKVVIWLAGIIGEFFVEFMCLVLGVYDFYSKECYGVKSSCKKSPAQVEEGSGVPVNAIRRVLSAGRFMLLISASSAAQSTASLTSSRRSFSFAAASRDS